MKTLPRELETKLEALIDSDGLVNVLDAIQQICYGKAEHIRSAWQDTSLANTWDHAASKLDKAIVAANLLPL